jgi:hypothetical protein
MKDTLIKGLTGEVAIIGTGAVASVVEIPTPDEIQSFGQLIIQAIIGFVTIWKVLRDKKREKNTYKENK